MPKESIRFYAGEELLSGQSQVEGTVLAIETKILEKRESTLIVIKIV